MNESFILTELIHPDCIPEASHSLLTSSAAQRIRVRGISSDSRSIKPGELFFAISGTKHDARKLINEAFLKGAVAALYEGELNEPPLGLAIPVLEIRRALSFAAHIYFNRPSLNTKLNIAVTGTSGKTSVAWIIAHALHYLGESTFLGGTLGYGTLKYTGSDKPLTAGFNELGNTSVDPISVHALLSKALNLEGATTSVFEATSQGVAQYRMRDIAWSGAIFTNLSRDHLDLHGTMERYEEAKRGLFLRDLASSSKEQRFAVINSDDAAGARLIKTLASEHPSIKLYTVSAQRELAKDRHSPSDKIVNYLMTELNSSASGTSFKLLATAKGASEELIEIANPSYIGLHNCYNLAEAAVALIAAGYSPSQARVAINSAPAVPGRLEPISGGNYGAIFIDYAHKPDALSKVLNFLRPLCAGKLIVVYGCGGERDPGKRPIMGEICYRLADISVVTSDNPRTENPESIIDQILSGVAVAPKDKAQVVVAAAAAGEKSVVRIADRRAAIAFAIRSSKASDIVLIAGKGHEPYQEINGVKHPFSDLTIARDIAHKGLVG